MIKNQMIPKMTKKEVKIRIKEMKRMKKKRKKKKIKGIVNGKHCAIYTETGCQHFL